MSCIVLNETDGRVSNICLARRLFEGEKTSLSCDTGVKKDSNDKNLQDDDIVTLVWHIKNKYYSADVNVFVSNSPITETFRVPPIGAIIFYIDVIAAPNCHAEITEHFIEKLNKWIGSDKQQIKSSSSIIENKGSSVLDEEPDSDEVRLVIAESFPSDEIKSAALNWAVNKGVEVIDFNEDENECVTNNSVEDTEQKIIKCTSNKRVIEALQTIPWSELEKTIKNDSEQDNNAESEKDKDVDLVGRDFEDLMSKLSNFKEKSDELPREDRYAFAEKVALSFFSAMGGDEESDSTE